MVWRKPMVASTEIIGAGVSAASQSSDPREGQNSSQAGALQSSQWHHEGLCQAVTSAEFSEEGCFNQICCFHPRLRCAEPQDLNAEQGHVSC